MELTISTKSDAPPIYQQLYDQVSAQILGGQLGSGDALPPIRTVAKELRVSVIPVKMAWEQLERDGLIYTMVGRGCFVAEKPETQAASRVSAAARERLLHEMEYCRDIGMTRDEMTGLVAKCFE